MLESSVWETNLFQFIFHEYEDILTGNRTNSGIFWFLTLYLGHDEITDVSDFLKNIFFKILRERYQPVLEIIDLTNEDMDQVFNGKNTVEIHDRNFKASIFYKGIDIFI